MNHLTKPFKTDLQLTNHRFNFDKCRVSMRVTVKRSEGHARITLIGVAYLMKAGKPVVLGKYTRLPSHGSIPSYKGPFKLLGI